jgi:peptidoglycan/LPS O-acetylase OafA/YrhL
MAGRRKWALASTIVAAATTTIYVVAIAAEGNNAFWDIFPRAALMLIGTGASLSSAVSRNPRVARSMAIAAVAVLGTLGVVAIFSVGLGFILAAILAGLAAAEPSRSIAT